MYHIATSSLHSDVDLTEIQIMAPLSTLQIAVVVITSIYCSCFSPPNIIFMLIDDLDFDDVSYHNGSDILITSWH